MPSRPERLGALVALLAATAVCYGQTVPKRDTQLWNELTVTHAVRRQITVWAFGSLRLFNHVSRLAEKQVGGGVNYAPSKFLSLGPAYRFVATHPTPSGHTRENRWWLDATFKVALRRLTVSDRSRVEVRRLAGAWSERYRNRLQVERELSFDGHRITPFAAVEAIYDTRFSVWNRKRLYVGARIPLSRRVSLEPYFMRQRDSRSAPHETNVIYNGIRLQL
jgi:Protein of unknown function (DUF2490)